MSMSPSITIGEVIHDHYGSYITIHSGKISKDDIDTKILQDTRVGVNANDNIIIDFGLSDNSPYFWVCYNSKESEDSVSVGRSHAVYTDCSLESLYEFESLLRFHFADARESQSYVCGNNKLVESRTIDWQNVNASELNIEPELLAAIIAYCLKKRKNGFKNFLRIIVPDDVTDYQNYCLKAIATIFNAIPVGLRKQFRIATNAAEENEELYHICFSKESVFSRREKKGDYVRLGDNNIPQFMRKIGQPSSLDELIKRCVAAPQWTRNSSVDDCYINMEQHKKSVADIRERDYSDYYDILKLRFVEITPEVLKEYDNKLSQNLSAEQMDMLKKQILGTISDISAVERNLDKAELNAQADTFDGFLQLLASYKHLINYLQECQIFLSQEYLSDKIVVIKEEFSRSFVPNAKKSPVAQRLECEKGWKEELDNYKNKIEKYFWRDAFNPYIKDCESTISSLEEQYKNECLQSWRRKAGDQLSAETISKYCQNVRTKYPEELLPFCNELMSDFAQNSNSYNGQVVKLIKAIIKECPAASIDEGLYPSCKRELLNSFSESVNEQRIIDSVDLIRQWFGQEKCSDFVPDAVNTVTVLFNQAKAGKGCCARLGNDEIIRITNRLKGYYSNPLNVQELSDSSKKLICSNLEREALNMLNGHDLSADKLEGYWMSINKYLSNDRAGADQVKEVLGRRLFDYMKKCSAKANISLAAKKNQINDIYGFAVAKNINSREMNSWYKNWENEGRRIERKNQISNGTNSFLGYLYACKNDEDAVKSIGQANLRKQVFESYYDNRTRKMSPDYSVRSYLNAILYDDDIAMNDLLSDTYPDIGKKRKFYYDEFIWFCTSSLIPVVISEHTDLVSLRNDLLLYSSFHPTKDKTVKLKYYGKKREHIYIEETDRVLEVVEDLIYLRSGTVAGSAENCFRCIGTNKYENIWKFFVDAKLVTDRDINALKDFFGEKKSQASKTIIEYYESKQRKKSLKAKLVVIGLAVIGLLLLSALFFAGYKVGTTRTAPAIVEPEAPDTGVDPNTENEINSGSETSPESVPGHEERDDSKDIPPANNHHMPEKTEEPTEKSDENSAPIPEGTVSEDLRYVTIQDNGSSVRIRAGSGSDTPVLAMASSSDNLVLQLVGGIIVSDDEIEWQKVKFTDEFIDEDGNIVPEGTEAYVAAQFITPIE